MEASLQQILQKIILVVPGFLLAVTVHEFAHGYVAYRLGDPTAKNAGRLTFNPIPHIDPLGAIALVFTQMIGWAKPVPVDMRNLRNPLRDMVWISVAGPASNMIAAVGLTVVMHLIMTAGHAGLINQSVAAVVIPFYSMLWIAVQVNVGLAIFNLLPVPPLDGSKILEGFLPRNIAYQMLQYEQYGFFILLALIFFGIANQIIGPPIRFVLSLMLTGLPHP
ncbi:MAG: site-2 protease family protein [Pseudomonadota bacterium]